MDELCVRDTRVEVRGGRGVTKQITIMEPKDPLPAYDREKARVQFHQCALLSS